MKYAVVLLALLACSKSTTGPATGDPVLLIRNTDPGQTVTFTWRDGQGVVGTDIITATGTFCERFNARPDSAYFEFVRQDSTGGWHTLRAPWFNPTARPAWTVDIYSDQGHQILVRDTTAAPC